MAIDKALTQALFNPYVRQARKGLTDTTQKITNLQRQGTNIGRGYREALHGFGSALSQGFAPALSGALQQRQFEQQMSLAHEQYLENKPSTFEGILDTAGNLLDLAGSGVTIYDALKGVGTTTAAKTAASTVSGGIAELGAEQLAGETGLQAGFEPFTTIAPDGAPAISSTPATSVAPTVGGTALASELTALNAGIGTQGSGSLFTAGQTSALGANTSLAAAAPYIGAAGLAFAAVDKFSKKQTSKPVDVQWRNERNMTLAGDKLKFGDAAGTEANRAYAEGTQWGTLSDKMIEGSWRANTERMLKKVLYKFHGNMTEQGQIGEGPPQWTSPVVENFANAVLAGEVGPMSEWGKYANAMNQKLDSINQRSSMVNETMNYTNDPQFQADQKTRQELGLYHPSQDMVNETDVFGAERYQFTEAEKEAWRNWV